MLDNSSPAPTPSGRDCAVQRPLSAAWLWAGILNMKGTEARDTRLAQSLELIEERSLRAWRGFKSEVRIGSRVACLFEPRFAQCRFCSIYVSRVLVGYPGSPPFQVPGGVNPQRFSRLSPCLLLPTHFRVRDGES